VIGTAENPPQKTNAVLNTISVAKRSSAAAKIAAGKISGKLPGSRK
jgi:hypothetical protein